MANGSRRWFSYTSDRGTQHAINLDESTYETSALGMGQSPPSPRNPIQTKSRIPFRPRYVLAFNKANPLRKRKLFVGTASALNSLATDGEVTIDGVDYGITGYVGEAGVIVSDKDTAQTDGDLD